MCLLTGREFKALFISTVESLNISGCSNNPDKSLCNPIVFNTAITRAASLIVAVGNPYILMAVEDKMGTNQQCWAEYLHTCFKTATVVLTQGVRDQNALDQLRQFVESKRKVKPSATEPHPRVQERAEERTPTTPVQVQATGVQVAAATPSAAIPVVGMSAPVRTSAFFHTGKEIYLGLTLPGASISHLTIKMTGPFQDESKALANTQSLPQFVVSHEVAQRGTQECIIKLPALHQPGVFMVVISSGAKPSINETFFLNIFDPGAVKLRGNISCIVNQKQQWEADCSRAGPGFLEAKVDGNKIPIVSSPSDLHTIAFTPVSVGQHTLEVTYNGHDTRNSQTFNVH